MTFRIALVLAGVCVVGAAAQTIAPPVVDTKIKVPAGHRVSAMLLAVGEQAYRCQCSDTSGCAWGPGSIPSATLWSPWTRKAGEHGFDGKLPFWRLNAGGTVTAKRLEGSPAPDKQSIDWLLLQAESATGGFAGVKFVQRLYTGGGQVPEAKSCTAATAREGRIARVPYTATYYFWVRP